MNIVECNSGRAGADTWVAAQTMSDCLYRWHDHLPGCPEPASTRLRLEYNRRAAEAEVHWSSSNQMPLVMFLVPPVASAQSVSVLRKAPACDLSGCQPRCLECFEASAGTPVPVSAGQQWHGVQGVNATEALGEDGLPQGASDYDYVDYYVDDYAMTGMFLREEDEWLANTRAVRPPQVFCFQR